MANQNYMHIAEIMKASTPFFDPRTKTKVELMGKLLDLMGSFSLVGRDSMVACGYEPFNLDMEGLLNGIRPLCDHKEREFVDRILNIFNAKRMFEMYNNFMNMMKTMQEAGGFSFGDGEAQDDTENVTGNFTGTNYDSIFQAFGLNHNTSEEHTEKTPEPDPGSAGAKGGGGMDTTMFDMLKTMVPPEQQSTFDSLRMLFNTMSYDNNNPDHKENKDV